MAGPALRCRGLAKTMKNDKFEKRLLSGIGRGRLYQDLCWFFFIFIGFGCLCWIRIEFALLIVCLDLSIELLAQVKAHESSTISNP